MPLRAPALAVIPLLLSVGAARGQTQLSGVLNALPANADAEQIVSVQPGVRTFYLNRAGEVWLYIQPTGTNQLIVPAKAWDASLTAKRDFLVFTRANARGASEIWALPLDLKTGAPSGSERKVLISSGDAPALSPDGRSIAFARDDSTGVGQSLVVLSSIEGGTERVIAAGMPSSIRSIAWTPDGKTIYFGVNPPVACVPEWSCLALTNAPKKWGSIRRVSASGGPVTVVAEQVRTPFPGLSPDGTTIVYAPVDGATQLTVANPDGTTRTSVSLNRQQSVQGWTGGATLVVGDGAYRAVRTIYTLDLSPNGKP